jgi:hypothetical protein
MLAVDLARAPLSVGEIQAERASLEKREHAHVVMLGFVLLALVAMGWTVVAHLSPAPTVSFLGMVIAAGMACRVGSDLLTLAAEFAALQPANPIELLQVPTLVQYSPLCASYVARVAAAKRDLIGAEFTALVREADRAARAAARVDVLAGAFHEVSVR